jgi:hypothetical protein
MTPPLSPERLTRMLDDAVRPVTARPGALDRIRHGARRRRTARRAGVALLTAAVIASGTATALVVTSGGGPARVGALSSSASSSGSVSSSGALSSSAAKETLPPGQTRTAALPSVSQQAVPSAAPSTPPSSAKTAPSSSAGQPTPAPATSGTSAPASAPPSANQPAAAGAPSVTGSGAWAIDGLGQPAATVAITPVGRAKTTSSFLLVVHTAGYGTQTVPFSATSVTGMPPSGPVVVGAADAAKDGHTELFVMIDAGCCTEFWTIFRLVDEHIAQVRMDGAPVRLAVGGSVMDNAGFSCDGPYLVTYSYTYQPASGTRVRFLATRDTYRWAGAALVLVSQRQATIRGERNPELMKYAGVSCGALPQYELKR